jgi:hypothetical protein
MTKAINESAEQRERRLARVTPEQKREYTLKRRYGLTISEYNAKFEAQGGVCSICHGDNGEKRLCVDHNHETGAVRGLLCHRCNLMLGYSEERRELLGQCFITYLDKWNGA